MQDIVIIKAMIIYIFCLISRIKIIRTSVNQRKGEDDRDDKEGREPGPEAVTGPVKAEVVPAAANLSKSSSVLLFLISCKV